MTSGTHDPTPEELVDQLSRYHGKSPVKYDRVLRRVIKDAERLGRSHQTAVSQWMAELAGVAPTKSVGTSWTHPLHEDVTLELVLKIDDKMFCARERVSFDTWFYMSKDIARWEQFLNHFTRQAVGSMSQDPEQFAYLRRKLFVVTPEDRHDSRLCRASNDTGLNKDLWPRCLHGVVRRAQPSPGVLSYMDSPVSQFDLTTRFSDARPLGKCACRCHRHPMNTPDPEYHVGFLTPYDDRGFFS